MRAVTLIFLSSFCVLATFPIGGLGESFPGPTTTEDIRFNQQRADQAFEAKRYGEAYRIYERELVSTGDKFAQYRVGWMRWKGLGISKDRVEGAAWLRLAAERGESDLVELRDRMFGVLSAEESEQAGGRFERLQRRFGDCAILKALVRTDARNLEALTGSRLQSEALPVRSIGGAGSASKVNHQLSIRKSLRLRDAYLREHCASD